MVLEMTTTELQTLRDNMIRARNNGLSELRSGDKYLKFKTDDEFRSAISGIDAEIAKASGASSSRSVFVQTSRG
jgi:hypothetical protein